MTGAYLGFPYWKPVRRRFEPDSPFFLSSNIERELLAKQVFDLILLFLIFVLALSIHLLRIGYGAFVDDLSFCIGMITRTALNNFKWIFISFDGMFSYYFCVAMSDIHFFSWTFIKVNFLIRDWIIILLRYSDIERPIFLCIFILLM